MNDNRHGQHHHHNHNGRFDRKVRRHHNNHRKLASSNNSSNLFSPTTCTKFRFFSKHGGGIKQQRWERRFAMAGMTGGGERDENACNHLSERWNP